MVRSEGPKDALNRATSCAPSPPDYMETKLTKKTERRRKKNDSNNGIQGLFDTVLAQETGDWQVT